MGVFREYSYAVVASLHDGNHVFFKVHLPLHSHEVFAVENKRSLERQRLREIEIIAQPDVARGTAD